MSINMEEAKLSLFIDGMMYHVENPEEFAHNQGITVRTNQVVH